MTQTHWKIWIDTGGTFTDCLATSPAGEFIRLKILSSSVLRGQLIEGLTPRSIKVKTHFGVDTDIFLGFTIRFLGKKVEQRKIIKIDIQNSIIYFDKDVSLKKSNLFEITSQEEVPVLAARLLTKTSLKSVFPPIELKLGSTKGTNALLERKGASTAFIVTKGFKDLLLIGNQQRPNLFSLKVEKPKPLYSSVMEVDERIEFDGNVLRKLQLSEVRKIIQSLKKQKIQSVAIALLNSYKNPQHELQLSRALSQAGIAFVSLSHQLSAQIKILPRAETAVVNAYLHPVINQYLTKISDRISLRDFKVMSSAGGLLNAATFQPKDSLLSGPAGGVMGAIKKARLSEAERIITFDMGGTSTDVSLSNGRPEYRFESVVGDLKILSPSLAIETIAAGGGSICDFDGYRFTVGPESAGAFPGPACYGAGGPLTITDVNLLLGKLDDENFSIPLHRGDADRQLKKLSDKIFKFTGKQYSNAIILEAFIQIANEKMAEAIRKVSIQNGYDPTEYAIVSFGGAGGQHACSLAEVLGIKKIVTPYDAGLLSAYGIGHASVERIFERLILKPINEFVAIFDTIFEDLLKEGEASLRQEEFNDGEIRVKEKLVYLRLKGQESSLEINIEEASEIVLAFKKLYKKVYGHWITDRPIEVESVRLRLGMPEDIEKKSQVSPKKYIPAPIKISKVYESGKWVNCPVFRWEQIRSGAFIEGPAIIISDNSTQYINSKWTFFLDVHNNGILKSSLSTVNNKSIQSEEAQLELFTNRFTSIAQDMGAMLQRTAFSVNVKERLDFSCALLDASGNLIVNAPHIPVHLGSLGVCVRSLMKIMNMEEGDVVVTNHPAYGGSHLPDITLVKPVYYKGKRIGFVVNRAHHAEVGGKQPGSMPADAKCLEEEGVVINPMYLMQAGEIKWNDIERVLLGAKYPTRAIHENLADLNASLASLQHGEGALKRLCNQFGGKETQFYMGRLTHYTASLMKSAIQNLSKKKYQAIERLDDGTRLKVAINSLKGKLKIDFSGSSREHTGNLNATPAIVNSVVLYVLRLLLNKNVPLNEGLLKHVSVIIPRGILNPKFSKDNSKSPAVVGGNTEVSQRLTDTLLKAFGLAACSQGTMNNFLFGNNKFGYYETIAGGTGAGPDFNGTHAVHQHMTNTRITDAEIMEWRYPVRVEKFEIRKNSGGKGRYRGGDGIVREIYFKEPLLVNVLTQHREEKPYGMKGGKAGKTGEQYLLRREGKKEKLKSIDGAFVQPGDSLVIKTPGGGGWGN